MIFPTFSENFDSEKIQKKEFRRRWVLSGFAILACKYDCSNTRNVCDITLFLAFFLQNFSENKDFN